MTRRVYKGSYLEALDQYFSGSPEELRESYRSALSLMRDRDEGLTGAVDELAGGSDRGPSIDAAAAAHFQTTWLEGKGQLEGQHVDAVMRRGYQEAIELALGYDEPVPIETFWVTGASNEFEMHICEGRDGIIVLQFLPLESEGSRRARSRSWVVGVGGPQNVPDEQVADTEVPIVKVQVSGAER